MVASKDIEPKVFMDKLEIYTKNNVARVMKNAGVVNVENMFSEVIKNGELVFDKEKVNEVLGVCPFCKNGQIVKNSKGYGCNNWKSGCKFFIGDICGKKYIQTI